MDKYNHWLGKFVGKLNGSTRYAITIGQTAYFSVPEAEVSAWWHRQEDEHKRQWRDEGRIKFLCTYIYYQCKYGYTNNPYEIAARKAETAQPEMA